jgi:hypothetical protein
MSLRIYTAGLCTLAILLTVAAAPPVDAAPKKKTYVYTDSNGRSRTRVVVQPRNFLDAGTEVLPGERKFTDYAFPPSNYSHTFSPVTNIGGRVGWHPSPLPAGAWDVPGLNRW